MCCRSRNGFASERELDRREQLRSDYEMAIKILRRWVVQDPGMQAMLDAKVSEAERYGFRVVVDHYGVRVFSRCPHCGR